LPEEDKNDAEEALGAELFDILSHPTRIKIIEILGEKEETFSDLKRKVGLESSGHLQFHLAKLEPPLVRVTKDGKNYALTDAGKEALRLFTQVVSSRASLVLRPQQSRLDFLNRGPGIRIRERKVGVTLPIVIILLLFLFLLSYQLLRPRRTPPQRRSQLPDFSTMRITTRQAATSIGASDATIPVILQP
jgi:DNA-binding transcriptional ArsR family regulator